MEYESLKHLLDKIPPEIQKIVYDLNTNHFEACIVGGCVRDLILGLKPKDYDVATNATPDQIAAIFPKSITTYAKFGIIF